MGLLLEELFDQANPRGLVRKADVDTLREAAQGSVV